MSILRPGMDIMVVPGNHGPTREFVEFMTGVIGFRSEQVRSAYLPVHKSAFAVGYVAKLRPLSERPHEDVKRGIGRHIQQMDSLGWAYEAMATERPIIP